MTRSELALEKVDGICHSWLLDVVLLTLACQDKGTKEICVTLFPVLGLLNIGPMLSIEMKEVIESSFAHFDVAYSLRLSHPYPLYSQLTDSILHRFLC